MKTLNVIQPAAPAGQTDLVFTIPIGLSAKIRLVSLVATLSCINASSVRSSLRIGDLAFTGQIELAGPLVATTTTIKAQWHEGGVAPVAATATGETASAPLPQIWWSRDMIIRLVFTGTTSTISGITALYELSDV